MLRVFHVLGLNENGLNNLIACKKNCRTPKWVLQAPGLEYFTPAEHKFTKGPEGACARLEERKEKEQENKQKQGEKTICKLRN